MRTHAQAVVIGGGVIGCSILYHLTRMGWTDVVLLERDELTSGSTWHAAANIHGLHDSTNISRIRPGREEKPNSGVSTSAPASRVAV